jgi:hypothetical protein
MSNTSIISTSCVATSEENGIGVKITFEGLDNLDEKLETAMDLVRAIFAQFKTHSSYQDISRDVERPREMKPKQTMTPISSADFIQACFSCLDEKKGESVRMMNLFNPNYNHLSNGYGVSDHAEHEQSEIIFLTTQEKVSLLQGDERFSYDPDTKSFSLKVEE